MVTLFTYDFSDLFKLNDSIQGLLDALPSVKASLLRDIVARFRSVIVNEQLTQNIRYTGTYEQSMKIIGGGSVDEPIVSLEMIPQGPQADRLPIYWKVLEFGADPSPNVLTSAIIDWASAKLGVGILDGINIANRIRSFGINPHPILQSVFVLTRPDGEVVGLTGIGESIVQEEMGKAMSDLVQVFTKISTRQVIGKSRVTGRFVSLK